jgi:predicted metalloenzyme YecM
MFGLHMKFLKGPKLNPKTLVVISILKREMFGFYLLRISYPFPYKKWTNSPLNMWDHIELTYGSTDSMMNLQKRWLKNGQKMNVYHLSTQIH